MSDIEAKPVENSRTKKKKRKLRSHEEKQRAFKTPRVDHSEEEQVPKEAVEEEKAENQKLEEGHPWRNLRLILSIQNKDLELQTKVQLAFDFVKSRQKEDDGDADQGHETVGISRLVVFLNDWVQSLLISSEKKSRVEGEKPPAEVIGTCFDFRCWEVFKFCLEESLKIRVSLNFSRHLLKAIGCIARNALCLLNEASLSSKGSFFVGEGFELYSIVPDCVLLVFSSHGGMLNENLELWMSTVSAVLELVQKVFSENLDTCNAGGFVLRFSCLVLEPFAKFLRVHPCRKSGFRDFIDKLLEQLLHLLGVLHLQIDGSHLGWTRKLLRLAEEVLSEGLFHPVHIDGFLSLHSTEKYVISHDGKFKDAKTVIKSYHRHLFDKLEKIMDEKKVLVLGGVGDLFLLLVDRVKNQTGASVSDALTQMIGKRGGSRLLGGDFSGHMSKMLSGNISGHSEKSYCLNSLNAEARKSLFDFFVQMMEPLLLEIKSYLQTKLEVGPVLLDAHCTFKSINNILASFMHEKVYVRTEDNSEGACLNFLKKFYDMIMSFSAKINKDWLSTCDIDKGTHMEISNLIVKELILAVGYLLEIEYEVIGSDLVSLWLMMLSSMAISLSLMGSPDQCLLTSKTLDLGCQLVKLYSELRQVNTIIFALCKAVRLLVLHDSDGEMNCSMFMSCTTSLSYDTYAKAVGMLICSQEFRLVICDAIKSIPEGQASGCIRQLTMDMSESLEWIKESCSVTAGKEFEKLDLRSSRMTHLDLHAEVLGRGLSELYTLVLDSLTVTTGNSNLIGVSIKEDLMTVIRPSMSSLVGLHPNSVNEFLLSVTGITFDNKVAGCKNDLLKLGGSTQWIFLFFFRLYMSCRSLYRQAISLMPPKSSKKLSAVMGDSFTTYSGLDWMERTDWTDKGYFSWIVQPSASLLIIIQSLSGIYFKDSAADCSPLIYVLHVMAFQRLVDLNRQIKSLEYLLQRNGNLVQNKLIDASGLSLYRKQSRKWEKCILVWMKEAGGLTDFIMEFLSLVAKKHQSTSYFDDATCKDMCSQPLHENVAWDMGICAVDEESLHTAIWWIVCQNIDMWCTHAAKKKLKMFLSLVIRTSLPSIRSNFGEAGHDIHEPGHLRNVTVQQMSLQILTDTVLYEQRFVCRHLASTFCRILEKSALSLFNDSLYGDFDFSSSPNWPEVLSELDNSLVVGSGNKYVMHDCSSVAEPISHLSNQVFPSTSMEFSACQRLLNLFCWMPKGYSNYRSFSLYAIYILNLERLVVGSLLSCHGASRLHNHYELFRMFVSCRRALKYLIMASCEENMKASKSSLTSTLSEGSFLVLWLLKSVSAVVGLQHAFSEDSATQVKNMIFSLMDHTSYIFLTLSKDQFRLAVGFLVNVKKLSKEQLNSGVANEQSNLNELDPFSESSKDIDAWKRVILVAETLKEQTKSLLISLKDAFCNEKLGVGVSAVHLNKLSSMVSCFQGFLWGIVSAVNHIDVKDCNVQPKKLRWKYEPKARLNLCLNVFTDFINFFLHMLLSEDDQCPESVCGVQNLLKSEYCDDLLGTEEFSLKVSGYESDISCGKQQQKSGATSSCLASSDIDDDSGNSSVRKKRLQSDDANCVASILAEIDSFDLQCLNKPLLQNLLNGNNPEAAFLLRQLFIACSALLRLNWQINYTPLSTSLVPKFIGISQVLLLDLADMVEVPQSFSFVWLDGVLKYLEELGSQFPLTNPILSRNVYAKLIDLHLRAIGKCISLQGKRATLASHETESSTKTLDGQLGLPEVETYCLDEFKARLRMSFRVFISKPSELHLLSAIQALERALAGVHEDCTMIYEINTGGADGGKVSSIVAAGIDCLDLVLEFVSGRKRLSVVKRHIQSLTSGLFSIILHLQSPLIFYGKLIHNKGDTGPDAGSVILMCVEVLTKVSGKQALFQMDSCHVVQSLRIPAALFQNFLHLRLSEAPAASTSLMYVDNQDYDPIASTSSCVVDRRFSIDLFAACCRLLYTVLKHHKSKCERCIALLQDSVCVLLHCLETVNADLMVRKGSFSWKVQEGIKCASFLRRIYEEIRHQRDVFGQHCFQFLSGYIWIYSGYGPLKTGIRREIDEALRPGVYALIDACSADDLQHLHTVFGEGPCRNMLATLQHDYKLNFQYGGKV
ncbi:hypothetical protein L1049_015758 [Liquidambar formosana]|uniref:Nucleolar 27S pre-rRNA processing Urb2/Npa2 C-terminal domain-containing protein n=1 Tax=Liquidambar formosana TaxID=63359 RepID=A0AAP0RYE7_LIQFO